MSKTLTAAIAAVTLVGAISATALPAQARDHDRGYGYGYDHGYDHGYGYRGYDDDHDRRHRDNSGAAIAAGVLGLALGAALLSSSRNTHNSAEYNSGGYYDRGDDDRGYYQQAYRVCEASRWVWDPYIGQRVIVRSRYAC